MMHYTRKRGIEVIWKTFRKQNRYQLVLNGCAGEVRESGRCPGFCLRTGWIDDGAVTKIGNLEGGGGGSLDKKKRNSTLDM